jgi:para-nitrobenzyl esterase
MNGDQPFFAASKKITRPMPIRQVRPFLPALFAVLPAVLLCVAARADETVHVATGDLAGTRSADGQIREFKGVPYAAPPVGDLRWKIPQPVAKWEGVRPATAFGARCMQTHTFSDMIFRDNGPSEDCLYLNVWTPAATANAKLPVMVWIYGGGFVAGAGSEPRQDGENLARKGVVVVNLNYRLGIFGFFSHPELNKESGHNSSGNYGLLDQTMALQWVKDNIAAFGGDPANMTIFGESAGSFSVSALMASPLSRAMFSHAIGESGAFFSRTLVAKSVEETAKMGAQFGESIGASSLAALRAKPGGELMEAAVKQKAVRFAPNIDGFFLPEDVYSIYAAGKQSKVPLLAGWNADEGSYQTIFGKEPATAQTYAAHMNTMFGKDAEALEKVYPATTDEEAKRAAGDLAGDQFIGFSTWKWIEMQSTTGEAAVYRYQFDDAPPMDAADVGKPPRGAYHSSEIEFVFNVLPSKKLPWREEDKKLADLMSSYWSNFAKTGNPNGPGLPEWPAYTQEAGYPVMHLSAQPHAAPDAHRQRYKVLDVLTPLRPVSTGFQVGRQGQQLSR